MYERMLDRKQRPTWEEMLAYCGVTAQLYIEFQTFLADSFTTSQEIRFPYGKEYGWCVTHRLGKKLICDVFAEAGAFAVMMRLSNEQYERIYEEVSDYTKNYIDHKYPCGSGGYIHYRVTCAEHMKDLKILMTAKME